MPRNKAKIKSQFIHWFTSHPWLKLIALLLAVVVWLYVKTEIGRFNY